MANIIDDLLGSELSLMFFISLVVWSLVFLYIFYLSQKIDRLSKDLESLKIED